MSQKFKVSLSITDKNDVIAWETKIVENKSEEEIEEEIRKLYPQEYWIIQSIEIQEYVELDPEEIIEQERIFEKV